MAPQRIHVKGYDKGTATKWMKPSPFVTVPIIFHITYINVSYARFFSISSNTGRASHTSPTIP